MALPDDWAELAEHGVPFWAMQNEDALKIFRLSAALNKKVHERVAKMKQVSRRLTGHLSAALYVQTGGLF